MTPYLIYASAVALFGGVLPSLHFGRRGNVAARVAGFGTVNFLLALGVGYLLTSLGATFLYGPFWGLGLTVLIFGAVNASIASAMSGGPVHGVWWVVAVVVLLAVRGCAGSGMWRSVEYRDLLGHVEERNWQDDMQPIDATHIRPVSMLQAEWLGNKVIGEAEGSLGSRYQFGWYDIQRVRNELYWVSPLEFRGFSKWWAYGHTTGFVMVSAEDRNRTPEFVDGFEFRYMPSAYFNANLRRHLYTNGYSLTGLTEFSFEVDDDLTPWWVITVFRPTIAWWGPEVDGVILVDPGSGEILPGNGGFYTPDEVPDWVDRVYPEEFVEDYITWRGWYNQRWVNSWWGQENVDVPTPFGGDAHNVVLIYGEDGQPKWFTGLTSVSTADQSLTGFMLVNSRTGEASRYRISGPNEEAVLQAVNNAVSNYTGWQGTTPLPYNVYGEFTWGVPVVGEDNIFMRMTVVRQKAVSVTLGEDVGAALRNYRASLASEGFSVAPTPSADLRAFAGLTVARLGVEPTSSGALYYLYVTDVPGKAFVAPSSLSPELPITVPGDRVSISYIETREPHVPLDSFDNEELSLGPSEPQAELTARREQIEAEIRRLQAGEEIQTELDNLSEQELRELLELLRERREQEER